MARPKFGNKTKMAAAALMSCLLAAAAFMSCLPFWVARFGPQTWQKWRKSSSSWRWSWALLKKMGFLSFLIQSTTTHLISLARFRACSLSSIRLTGQQSTTRFLLQLILPQSPPYISQIPTRGTKGNSLTRLKEEESSGEKEEEEKKGRKEEEERKREGKEIKKKYFIILD
ncbi:unnamed protein product [Prunus armeniaca]|uniref:Uncharacterized protein n=1 Tax=Prunus armeniaca TaxID=36596 RepID=A0A6J5U0T8_PRUAR|nr:unnamed protein product [Prunus armeniaca]